MIKQTVQTYSHLSSFPSGRLRFFSPFRLIAFVLSLFLLNTLTAAPTQRRGNDDADMRNALNIVLHEISNQQLEMKTVENRLETLDSTLEFLRDDIIALRSLQKDKSTAASQEVDSKLGNLDLSTKSVVIDLKAIKTQINETTGIVGQFKTRIAALEKIIDAQNQNIDALQAALRTLTDILQVKETVKPTKTYSVKNGDALEKIARAHQMSVEDIKELNGLTNTKIIVGQKLLVYEK